ncbi:MAG: Ribonuclease protein component [Gemmatimonadetes bacterium]|nr:Ribonuclease protein component [Gemmatimonadota bacterium]
MRIGIVVPKYTHNSVERNRLKRRLRELLRRTVLPMALPLDVVVRAKREGYSASFDDLARDVEQIRARLAS